MRAWILLGALLAVAATAQAQGIQYEPADPDTNDVIAFSTDATGEVVWDFDDGNQSIGRHVQHRYAVSAYYHVTLRQDGAVIGQADVPVKIPAEKYVAQTNSSQGDPPATQTPDPSDTEPDDNATEVQQNEPVKEEKDPLAVLTNPVVIGALAFVAGAGYLVHQKFLRAKDDTLALEEEDEDPPADPADRVDERVDVAEFYAGEDYREAEDDEADVLPDHSDLDEDIDMADEDELGEPDAPAESDGLGDEEDPIDGPGILGGQE